MNAVFLCLQCCCLEKSNSWWHFFLSRLSAKKCDVSFLLCVFFLESSNLVGYSSYSGEGFCQYRWSNLLHFINSVSRFLYTLFFLTNTHTYSRSYNDLGYINSLAMPFSIYIILWWLIVLSSVEEGTLKQMTCSRLKEPRHEKDEIQHSHERVRLFEASHRENLCFIFLIGLLIKCLLGMYKIYLPKLLSDHLIMEFWWPPSVNEGFRLH